LAIIPTTGIDDAVAELEHAAKVGLKGVALTSFPNGHGFPTPEDDRFWAASLDLRMPLAKHGGGRFAGKRDDPLLQYPQSPGDPDMHKADGLQELFRWCGTHACGVMQMAYAGVFDRFPTLQMYWAETMAGWIKYALWQMDDSYRRYRHMMRAYWALDFLERQPSDYIKEQNHWGFLYDPVGVELRDCIGADKLMWASDFAHAASDWPNSPKIIEEIFTGVPAEEKHAMLAGNAVKYWHLDD
jgi:predicted TIM-barrel fold metal-dependent hydrolase